MSAMEPKICMSCDEQDRSRMISNLSRELEHYGSIPIFVKENIFGLGSVARLDEKPSNFQDHNHHCSTCTAGRPILLHPCG